MNHIIKLFFPEPAPVISKFPRKIGMNVSEAQELTKHFNSKKRREENHELDIILNSLEEDVYNKVMKNAGMGLTKIDTLDIKNNLLIKSNCLEDRYISANNRVEWRPKDNDRCVQMWVTLDRAFERISEEYKNKGFTVKGTEISWIK